MAAESFAEGEARRELEARADALRIETRQKLAAAGADTFAETVTAALDAQSLMDRKDQAQRLASADAALLGAQALQVAWTEARAYGDGLSGWDDFTRHEFRKDIKSLRYVAEFFGDFWPDGKRKDFLAQLTRLQDALGEMNDIAEHLGDREPDEATRKRFDKAMAAAESRWSKLQKRGGWWIA